MLSNQQQQPIARRMAKHERQLSTPTTPMLNLPSAGFFPEITHTQGIIRQRPTTLGHRRGLSLDPSMRLQDLRLHTPQSPIGTHGMVSTNQGPVYQQHKMREAQMHGLSRPGQLDQGLENIMEHAAMMSSANFTPLSESNESFAACIAAAINADRAQLSGRLQDKAYIQDGMLIATPNQLSNASRIQDLNFIHSSPIRHGSIDLGVQNMPIVNRAGSVQGHTAMKRSQSQNSAPASTTSINAFQAPVFAPTPIQQINFSNMTNLDFDLQSYAAGYESSSHSTHQSSPAGSSMRATPDLPPVALFGEVVGGVPQLASSEIGSVSSSPRKSRSVSPRKKPAPLPEDFAIEETGITAEQVDAFIQGPDPVTNKFTCLFEGCTMKPFGRKENVRAHVQTHLGDRKYVCTVCDNRFVRPNDLKRHAIIHQEVKEFICKCGAAFGRQDALRRHRIRKPFCVDGDPSLELMRREEKKRGRPRKIAPAETNERRERKENIRKQVMESKRRGSLPGSVASTTKSVRSCSPEEKGSVSPTNMSLTPPQSPARTPHTIVDSESSRREHGFISLHNLPPSPSPEHFKRSLSQEFGIGHDSPFGEDHFEPFPGPASPPQSSVYGTPPELELCSSPAASRYRLDFSDGEVTLSATTSVHDFDALTATAPFSDDFLSESTIISGFLKGCADNDDDQEDSLKAGQMEDLERYLMLESM